MPQSSSHRRSLYPLAEALGDRGHNVTFFTEIVHDEGLRSVHPNVTDQLSLIEHDSPDFYDLWVHKNSSSFREVQWTSHSDHPWLLDPYWNMMIHICQNTMAQNYPVIRKLIQDHKWDLVISDALFAACGVAMIKMIKSPYIILNPTCITGSEAAYRSIPYPAATFPPLASPFDYSHKKFYDRLHSTVNYIFEYVMPYNWNRLLQNAVSQKFNQLSNVPLITWFYRNPEFSYSDLPWALEHPRPMLPDMLNTAGHCKTGSAILKDKEWISFVDDPTSKGTILLSFGHLVQWKWAPEKIIDSFFEAFEHLPEYRIAFQFDGKVKKSRKHVKTARWLPAVGLLNHPKTKLHLTHGGAKSLSESICANVPLVVLPVFGEQIRNADSVKRIGIGTVLDKLNLTAENIVREMKTVLENEDYYKRMEKLKVITTEPIRPLLETGVFWAEQVIKRGKMPDRYFKHKGRKLGWVVYFNLDVIVVALIVVGFIGWASFKLVKIGIRVAC